MGTQLLLAGLIWLLAGQRPFGVVAAPAGPLVETSLGLIRGSAAGGVDRFLGVRYAHDTSGSGRFGPARLFDTPWPGELDATQLGPICWQPSPFPGPKEVTPPPIDPHLVSPVRGMSEDCLLLSIYRRSGEPAAPRPVMVWIHGGGMTVGNSGGFDGSFFVQQTDVLLVMIEYRLGPLGFLSSPELGGGGMNGQLDQITALRWVAKHVGSFGGNPDAVTLFGCSAGSLSICTLNVSPLAAGLFHRIILQSGACTGPWGPGTQQVGYAVSARLMSQLNVSSLNELRNTSAALLQWPHSDALSVEFPGYWMDPQISPVRPSQAYANRSLVNTVQVMMGATNRDGVLTADPFYATPAVPLTNATNYAELMAAHWAGEYVPSLHPNESLGLTVAAQYSPSRPEFASNPSAAYVAADGDYNVLCPVVELGQALRRLGGQHVFVYIFAHGPLCGALPVAKEPGVLARRGWANHGSEQAYVFGQAPSCGWTADESKFVVAMAKYWGSFAVSGQPVAAGERAWPTFSSNVKGPVLDLDVDIGLMADSKYEDCKLWREVASWQSSNHHS